MTAYGRKCAGALFAAAVLVFVPSILWAQPIYVCQADKLEHCPPGMRHHPIWNIGANTQVPPASVAREICVEQKPDGTKVQLPFIVNVVRNWHVGDHGAQVIDIICVR